MGKEFLLMTGATGFLGSELVARLLETEDSIIILKRSFSNTSRIEALLPKLLIYDLDRVSLRSIFSKHKITGIVHCATTYSRNAATRSSMIESNLILPLELLELAVEFGTRFFLNTDTVLDLRVNHYSLSKAQFVDWMKTFSSEIIGLNVALEHFYGPGDDPRKFVTQMIDALLAHTIAIDLTLGEQERDFIYIDDVVSALLTLIRNSTDLENGFYRFEVGTGRPIKVKEFMLLLRELTGGSDTDLRFGAIPYRENEFMSVSLDLAPLTRLGWVSETSLRDGLKKTVTSRRKSYAAE